MRICFVLSGMHREQRGAEVAFESIASELARSGEDEITVVGSGAARPGQPYRFVRHRMVTRDHFEKAPMFPPLRTEYAYEEATFAASFLSGYRPGQFDVTVGCTYPFLNWAMARWPPMSRRRPAHVYVTQNGDAPALLDNREYRFFRCDGLICTNPHFFERNRRQWYSTLIPNGIDPGRFRPGTPDRARLGLPTSATVVLMVAAMIESKRVIEGILAVSRVPDTFLVVAGDGPLREQVDQLAAERMPGRFLRLTLPASEMPNLYRCADVFVHPTLFESFGNVYIEALASGVPVVAHDYSVTRWIFGECHPGLVDATDIDELSQAVQDAAGGGDRDALGRVAATVDRFSWPSVAAQYRHFLGEVAQRRASASH